MTGFIPLLKKELTEQWKTNKVLILASVFLLFGISIPLSYKYMPDLLKLSKQPINFTIPTFTAGQTLAGYAGNIGQVGLLVVVLVAMGAVATELRSGTAVITLSKPVSYAAFVNTKFCALSLNLIVSLIVASLVCFAYTFWLIGPSDVINYVGMNLMLLVFLEFSLAVTLICSCLFKSSVACGGLSLGILILQAIISALPVIGNYMPGKLLDWGNNLVTGVGITYWWSLGITLALTLGCLVVAPQVLKNKEI